MADKSWLSKLRRESTVLIAFAQAQSTDATFWSRDVGVFPIILHDAIDCVARKTQPGKKKDPQA